MDVHSCPQRARARRSGARGSPPGRQGAGRAHPDHRPSALAREVEDPAVIALHGNTTQAACHDCARRDRPARVRERLTAAGRPADP
jgi:hypothetical protein